MRLAPGWVLDADGAPWYRNPSKPRWPAKGVWRVCQVCSERFASLPAYSGKHCSPSCRGTTNAGKLAATRPDLFEHWTADECYLAGLIFSDGHLVPGMRQINLAMTDEDAIAAAAAIAGCRWRTRQREAPRKPLHLMSFNEKKAVNRIAAIGMDQPKLTLRPFPDLPHPAAFLRGAFDGDGSVCHHRGRIKSCLCGSRQLLAGVQDFLAGQGIGRKTIGSATRKQTLYTIQWAHKDSLRLAEIMYANPGPRIERKWAKFYANPDRF